jgi:hypothetical protein
VFQAFQVQVFLALNRVVKGPFANPHRVQQIPQRGVGESDRANGKIAVIV